MRNFLLSWRRQRLTPPHSKNAPHELGRRRAILFQKNAERMASPPLTTVTQAEADFSARTSHPAALVHLCCFLRILYCIHKRNRVRV